MSTQRPVTLHTLHKRKRDGERITMLTAYDATFARLMDQSDIDVFLVGDSLGNVIQGRDTTIPVTLEDIIYHTRAVVRGTQHAHIVADMPFLSYGAGDDDAVRNAGRLMKEGGAHAVKLEGAGLLCDTVRRITSIGIPVMGHLGLTPQSVHALGGFRVQGRGDAAAERLLNDALALQESGAYAVVLEMVPTDVARRVTDALEIPTIGIGAGPHTDGQVLVCYDMLGLNEGFKPKSLKHYTSMADTVKGAAATFADEVRAGAFPDDDHSFEK